MVLMEDCWRGVVHVREHMFSVHLTLIGESLLETGFGGREEKDSGLEGLGMRHCWSRLSPGF